MINSELIKDIFIKENDDIIQKIESNFPMLQDREWCFRTTSKKNHTKEYKLTEGIPVNYYALIKR